MEVVGVEDAARALILAAEKGRVGERYIISERFISARELYGTAAEAGGTRPPRVGIPLQVMYALGFGGDIAAILLRRDMLLSTLSVRLCTSCPQWTTARPSVNWVGIPSRSTTRFDAQWRSTGIGARRTDRRSAVSRLLAWQPITTSPSKLAVPYGGRIGSVPTLCTVDWRVIRRRRILAGPVVGPLPGRIPRAISGRRS